MILSRPNSDGLELLETLIRENSNKMDSELLYSLTDAYNRINEDVEYTEREFETELSYYTEDVERLVKETFNSIDNLFDTNDCENEEVIIIHEKVSNVISEFEIPEFESTGEPEKSLYSEMEKMIAAGYTFQTGLGLELTKKKVAEERARLIGYEQREKGKRFNKTWEDIRPYEIRVKKIDHDRYELISYVMGIDAIYDYQSKKIKGKGSRGHKEEIIKTMDVYVDMIKDFA